MAELSFSPVPDAVASTDYLVVDEFLGSLIHIRALKSAFELGLIDRLAEVRTGGAIEALGRAVGADPPGFRLLLDLLATGGIIEERDGDVRLSRRFRTALRYRDLLETKLDFVGLVLTDFADLFTSLVRGPAEFMGKAQLFQLFDYRRATRPGHDNYVRTSLWMRLTTALSRYEAEAAEMLYDFGQHRRMLDVGGNSGEYVLQLCRRNPQLRATVFDLPVVCDVGMEHVLSQPEHDRISFVKGDLRQDQLPGGYDLVSFKSMLHDWPEKDTVLFLSEAVRALQPGGRIVVFERAPMRFKDVAPPVSMLPTLLFFRSYRPASDYLTWFAGLGLVDVKLREITLDSQFYLISGRKP